MRGYRRGLLPPLLCLLVLSSCGPLSSLNLGGAPSAAAPGTKEKPSAAEDRVAAVRQSVRRQLSAGHPDKALSQVGREVQGGVPEAALAAEYREAVNALLKQAERYRKEDRPEKAGPLYRAVLAGYPQTPAVARGLDLSAAAVAGRVAACADQLMERGLVAYRQGDLDRAISTWKEIQAFDPNHQASRQALQTAEIQRNNLEKVNRN